MVKNYFYTLITAMIIFTGCGERQRDTTDSEKLDTSSDYRVVGYVAGYRDFDFSKIQAEKLTHINYAFANVIDGQVMFDTADIDNTSLKDDDLKELQQLKSVNPDLKILVSVGG
jgi:chitinase